MSKSGCSGHAGPLAGSASSRSVAISIFNFQFLLLSSCQKYQECFTARHCVPLWPARAPVLGGAFQMFLLTSPLTAARLLLKSSAAALLLLQADHRATRSVTAVCTH